ncbi:HlyD family type I secretion periplasmic adaptor subunit [Thioclava sp. FR2]|uniref:HlyD family type I secretion periplasmic adaptor subunit n=1 Tax=Thioclava sp. FR2 TaxID=3445780 RepID=UPI003EBBC5A6
MSNPHLPSFLGARKALFLGYTTLAVLVGGFGLWSVTTTISGAIVAPGRIEVEQHRQIVQHPDGGVVAEILVSEGSSVQAGDILLKLDGTLLESERAIIAGQLSEVQARRARLEAERDNLTEMVVPKTLLDVAATDPEVAEQVEGQRRLFTARLETQARTTEQLEKRKAQTLSQIDGIDAQSKALSEQLDLIGQELADQRALLEKGLAQAPRVLALEREASRLSGQVGELSASRAQAEGRITEIELEILRLGAARREEASTQLRDIGANELQLVQKLRALTEQIARLDIRAPASGSVLGLQVTTPRAVLRPADPVAFIIPQDRPLIITTQIAPIHVDEVFVGQDVRLTFSAFSSRTTPELHGTVALVSADALTDNATNATYYRAEISLSANEAARLGQQLLPGMPVEAYIQTDARTPMAYLIKPFTDYFVRAFRES